MSLIRVSMMRSGDGTMMHASHGASACAHCGHGAYLYTYVVPYTCCPVHGGWARVNGLLVECPVG